MKKIMNKNNAIESNRYWKTHSGEECDDVSSETDSLKKHLKVHGGQKTNKCNQCGFASSSSSALRRHLKTHSGEKPNKCNQCDYMHPPAQFEDSFENTQWRKAKQMQPV